MPEQWRSILQVHCVSAFGKLQELLQRYSPFPDGLILHSWIGPADMVKSLAKVEGVFFSLSGHLTRMSKKKYEPMIKQVNAPAVMQLVMFVCVCVCVCLDLPL